jgi:predicted lipoprotein with Yx(FWY)xxD motif
MQRKITLLVAVAVLSAAALASAVLGEAGSASPLRTPAGARVALGKTALGKVLVDARGRTLYLFKRDKHGKSACYGTCASYWPPLLSRAKPRPGRGVRAGLLGSTTRTDGKRQVTYAGHPLYTFVLDKKPGQTKGEGLSDFGGAWDAVAPNGRAIVRTPSGGYGGGYGG